MIAMKKTVLCSVTIMLAAGIAAGQTTPLSPPQVLVLSGVSSGGGEAGGFVYHEVMRGGEFVKGAPYTATAVTETTQVLADGNRIVNRSTAWLARDSEGRTRREESVDHFGPVAVENARLVFIMDPMAKTQTILNLDDHTATFTKFEAAKVITVEQKRLAADTGVSPAKNLVDVKRDSLGVDTIEGISCDHLLTTETIPEGRIGNERPIVVTSDTCASAELHLLLLRKRNDPRYGTSDYQLKDIKRGEPNATLFQVPAGFKVVETTAPLRNPTP
jgi:hypothetical protein